MADNVNISTSASTSAVIAADQVSDGSYIQYVKLASGEPDSTHGVSADTYTHTVASPTSSGIAVMSTSVGRQYGLIINDSDTKIYIALATAANVLSGIALYPNGGAYEWGEAFGNKWNGAVWAIHGSTGTKTLLVTEGA